MQTIFKKTKNLNFFFAAPTIRNWSLQDSQAGVNVQIWLQRKEKQNKQTKKTKNKTNKQKKQKTKQIKTGFTTKCLIFKTTCRKQKKKETFISETKKTTSFTFLRFVIWWLVVLELPECCQLYLFRYKLVLWLCWYKLVPGFYWHKLVPGFYWYKLVPVFFGICWIFWLFYNRLSRRIPSRSFHQRTQVTWSSRFS